jgi:hypothetical protein
MTEPTDSLDTGKLTFSDFLLSMATNALVHMGGEDAPDRVDAAVDLTQAAQWIDILLMIKEKTKGNLEPDEQALIDSLLYDLRMKYLEVAQELERGR